MAGEPWLEALPPPWACCCCCCCCCCCWRTHSCLGSLLCDLQSPIGRQTQLQIRILRQSRLHGHELSSRQVALLGLLRLQHLGLLKRLQLLQVGCTVFHLRCGETQIEVHRTCLLLLLLGLLHLSCLLRHDYPCLHDGRRVGSTSVLSVSR